MSRQLAAVVRAAYPRAMDSLVSTEWLAQHLDEPDLVVVDASWHMPASGRSGREEYLEAHIPGARFLDIDELADKTNPAPHALPTAKQFEAAMKQLGVGSSDRIVVYDNSPIRNAARGWFMFRHFGAGQVAILDGGFQKWVAEGRPAESGEPPSREARFDAVERDEVVTKEQLLTGSDLPWVDARGRPRFEGTEADPRPDVTPGHAPGARNLPFASLYREDGTFKPVEELRQL
ncbi:MAG: sulfurtransferase, partial [Bradyrhizobium sp.]|nr:sulfurtransferase [Bradyrhizobium sp.]